MIALAPAEWFALGVLAGIVLSLSAWGAVVFWVDEIQSRRRRATGVSALAEAVGVLVEPGEDVPTCEDCKVRLTEDNTAVTCDVHDLCIDCDAHNNTSCTQCRDARRSVSPAFEWTWA